MRFDYIVTDGYVGRSEQETEREIIDAILREVAFTDQVPPMDADTTPYPRGAALWLQV